MRDVQLDKYVLLESLQQFILGLFHPVYIAMALILFGPGSTLAGDYAQPNLIGYSPDFRFFAYEEFGIEDGSGFPYSNFYLIDLKADPAIIIEQTQHKFDLNSDPPPEELVHIRMQAFEKAQVWIDGAHVAWPAQLLAYNGDGVPDNLELKSDQGLYLRFGPTGYNGAVTGDYLLSLIYTEVQTSKACTESDTSQPVGFTLNLTDNDYDTTYNIYQTMGLPIQSVCPLSFTISGVYAPFEANDISDAIALISIYSQGYEGLDRRFMVVPIPPKPGI